MSRTRGRDCRRFRQSGGTGGAPGGQEGPNLTFMARITPGCGVGHPEVHLEGAVPLSADTVIASGSSDGTTRLWDALTGKELCSLVSLDEGKDWLVVSPDGFFDGSKGGWRYVSYRRPCTLELVDDEATLQRFYRPGLMGLLLKGQKVSR